MLVVDMFGSKACNEENAISKRRKISVGDFVVMRRDSERHKNKLLCEFLGPYEVICILARD